jgi:hypothetical protein
MKRTIWLVVLFTTLTMAWGQVQVTVGSVNAVSGSKVVVPVNISEGQGISAIQFDLAFDTTVLSLTGTSAVLKGDSCLDHGIVSSIESGTLKAALVSGSLSLLKPGAGTLVQLIFDVASGASQGATANLTLANVRACDASGTEVSTTAVDGIVTISSTANQPVAGQNSLVFPQIANGAVGQGAFYTIVILINQTAAPANARVKFLKANGTPFSLTTVSQGTGSEFDVTVSAEGSVYLRTDGTGTLETGYAQVTSTGPIGGTVMFGWRSGAGTTITEAGVGAADSKTEFSVPVIYGRNASGTTVSSTGIAVANTATSAAQLTVRLKDTSGTTVATKTIDLAAGQQKARYVHEQDLFPTLASSPQMSFIGTLHITASQKGVGVTAVKQSLQEGLITTFPIVEMK